MPAPEWTLEEIARWGAIAAPAGVALVLIAGRFLSGSPRRVVPIEMAASLAAAAGLGVTFLDLRKGAGALSPVFAPALAGLGVYVFCQGVLGVFRFWCDGLKPEGAPAVAVPPREGAAPQRRPRRPAPSPVPVSGPEAFRNAAVVVACMIGSVLLHSAVFFVAQRVQTAPIPSREPERAGVFAARLVSLPRESPPPPEEVKEEPPPPPKPLPPLNEPPPPEPPKAETPEPAPLTESPKPDAPAEKPKAEAPPSAPAPVAEAKEIDRGRPAAAPPPAKVTETPPAPAPAAAAPPPTAGADPAVLGFGDPGKAKEKEPGAEPRGAPAGISTLKEYRQFLAREMKAGAPEGQYVPNLRFGDNLAQENREIMRYFGMELIAYPKNQKFYVYIDPDRGLYSRSNDFEFIRKFSSRAIFRTSPYFDGLRAEAARRADVAADALVVAQLLKPSSAAYIGWKEAECARRAGVALDGVEACDASFVKSPLGVWIVRIDRLLLKDGRALAVEDFEWAKVSAAGGGER